MNYARVKDNKVVEVLRGLREPEKDEGWIELTQVKPNHDKATQFLVHSHYEIERDSTEQIISVLEHFRVEDINFNIPEGDGEEFED